MGARGCRFVHAASLLLLPGAHYWAAAAWEEFRLLESGVPQVTVSFGAEEAGRLYDPSTAQAMAALSKLVYCGPLNGTEQAILSSTEGVMAEAGLRLSNPLLVTRPDLGAALADFAVVTAFSSTGAIGKNVPRKGCVVAFRGTDNEANNVENSRQRLQPFVPADCHGCMVFGGYLAIWKELWAGVLDALFASGCLKGDPLFVTGHNLGAGLATLAMYSLKSQDGYDVQPSYNFESPRVGNEAFAHSFGELFGQRPALFRVTHHNDAVPHYPKDPSYAHVGNEVWYPSMNRQKYTICPSTSTITRCGNDALAEDHLCPLAPADCQGEAADFCRANCGFPPHHGPHCEHPLAPAENFCSFSRDTRANAQRDFHRSCILGKAAFMTTAEPTSTSTSTAKAPGLVHCSETGLSWQPLDMLGTGPTVEDTPAACQERCQRHKGCAHFSFFYDLKSCHLEDKHAYKMKGSVGVLAGPRTCGDREESSVEAKFLSRGALASYKHGVPVLATAGICLALASTTILTLACRAGSTRRLSLISWFRRTVGAGAGAMRQLLRYDTLRTEEVLL